MAKLPKLIATNIIWDTNETYMTDVIIDKNLVSEALKCDDLDKLIEDTMTNLYGTWNSDMLDEKQDEIITDLVYDVVHHNRLPESVEEQIPLPPTEVELPIELWIGEEDPIENITNYLSDIYGFCLKNYSVGCDMTEEEINDVINSPKNTGWVRSIYQEALSILDNEKYEEMDER